VIRLGELSSISELDVRRDGEIRSLGVLDYDSEAMLVFLDDEDLVERVRDSGNISCVITTSELAEAIPDELGLAVAAHPRGSFYEVHNHLAEHTEFYGSHPRTKINQTAQIHPTAYVAPHGVQIARDVVIEPNVTILGGVQIHDGAIVRAGTTVGTEGFEHKRVGGEILSVIHAGGVRIGSRVEIQANCSIDRAVFGGHTAIGSDTKLADLVHVAHNVTIGQRCLIAASAMIAGSTNIGDDVWIGPGASLSSGLTIGSGAEITIGSVVTRDVEAGSHVTGNFAIEHGRFIEFLRSIR
jgi:UDP-3-O-[3-hydroxymyristoyl] glucosamine N-acyltransferase